MDQKTLSKRTGIQQPNISRIEQKGYVADPGSYRKIAAVFGIDYKELLP
jgi:transcriptional regulator with XRE-family HTH domain